MLVALGAGLSVNREVRRKVRCELGVDRASCSAVAEMSDLA